MNKRLFLTIKPIMLKEGTIVLLNREYAKPGSGFCVCSTYWDLSFKQLEEIEKIDRKKVLLGKTMKFFVLFTNFAKKHIALTLSKPLESLFKGISYTISLKEFIGEEKSPEEREYQVLKPKNNLLPPYYLFCESLDKKSRSFIHRNHISDLKNSKLFDFYSTLLGKGFFTGLIIGTTGFLGL